MKRSYPGSTTMHTSTTIYHPVPIRKYSDLQNYSISSLPRHKPRERPCFIRSPHSAFKEWQEMKLHFSSMQQALCGLLQQIQQAPAANGVPGTPTVPTPLASALTATLQHSQLQQRKRPAPSTLPQQPECPVALRPLPTPCPMPNSSLIGFPWSFPIRAPSPTLPAPPVQEQQQQSAPPTEPMTEQKWSSPSSVDSNGQKTDSTAASAESANIDIVGMDGSESSTSSTSTQAMVTSPDHNNMHTYLKDSAEFIRQRQELLQNCYPFKLAKTDIGSVPFSAALPMQNAPERKHRKQVSDDYVKIIRQQDLTENRISKIQIPVPEAMRCDPNFRPVSEQQIVQQVIQNKKFEETQPRDSMVHLCKKLAEKRVFGAKLMSQTTVAGLNHSNYSNLPIEGIIYIQDVCHRIMGNRFENDDDFWDAFRESTKKLAARCRRVRHAKKSKSKYEDSNGMPEREEKPECSVANTLLSLNIVPPPSMTQEIKPRSIQSQEQSVIEILQKMPENQPTIQSILNGKLDQNTLQTLLSNPDNPAWALINLSKVNTINPDEHFEPISP